LIVASPLVYIATNSVSTAFAISDADITVLGNDNPWQTNGVENQINGPVASILITSDVDVNNFQCELQHRDGTTAEGIKPCLSTPTEANAQYKDLDGSYIFVLKVTPSDGSGTIVLNYNFNTFGSGGGAALGFSAGPSTEKQEGEKPAQVETAGSSPPWTSCPAGANNQNIPDYIKEIRYETLGTANLKKVLESKKQDLDFEVVVNFVTGNPSGKISNDQSTDFAVHSTHTECEYVAPESSFSTSTGASSESAVNDKNSKASNPPFTTCKTTDESAKYEINTRVSSGEENEIKFIHDYSKTNQDVKLVITQFFKTKTAELGQHWYMGELIIEGGKADGMKIDLDLTGTDLHTSCLGNFIA